MTGQTRRCPCGCRQPIAAVQLVCRSGWERLPEPLRRAVRETEQAQRLSGGTTETVAEHRAAGAAARSWWALNAPPRPVLVTADVTPEPIATRDYCDSCHAPILWCLNAQGGRVPVDPQPVRATTGAADCVVTERGPGLSPRVRILRSQGELFGRRWAHRLHMSTCPYAERHRARARRGSAQRIGGL